MSKLICKDEVNTQKISNRTCNMCKQTIVDDHESGILTRCNHEFHNKCISKWLYITHHCPCCSIYNSVYYCNGKHNFIRKFKQNSLKCLIVVDGKMKCSKCNLKCSKNNPMLKCSDCFGYNKGFIHIKCYSNKIPDTKYYCNNCKIASVKFF